MICTVCKTKESTKGCLTCSFKCACLAAGTQYDEVKSRLDAEIKERIVTRYRK